LATGAWVLVAQHCKNRALCASFQQFVRSLVGEFDSFQTVS
jgi:hypothetical protein